ncbi:hemerythrin HHE cation binding domain-containing protein [Thermoplasmatales archaeon SCGC AB-540-F20]|nr:hemerythrin HHE cation binding domain-containing protein [Thermoplasmatales archaeon SCGC AB-540-F20]
MKKMRNIKKMKSTAILDRMVKDHGKIVKLLNDVEKVIDQEQDIVSTMKVFDKFEWNLEKHIFVEEKAIFTSYNPENVVEGYKMLPELTKQHNEILHRLDLMRKDVRSRRTVKDVYSFKEFLIKHKNFEEKDVYPKLDQELDETQKRQIIDKINEIV